MAHQNASSTQKINILHREEHQSQHMVADLQCMNGIWTEHYYPHATSTEIELAQMDMNAVDQLLLQERYYDGASQRPASRSSQYFQLPLLPPPSGMHPPSCMSPQGQIDNTIPGPQCTGVATEMHQKQWTDHSRINNSRVSIMIFCQSCLLEIAHHKHLWTTCSIELTLLLSKSPKPPIRSTSYPPRSPLKSLYKMQGVRLSTFLHWSGVLSPPILMVIIFSQCPPTWCCEVQVVVMSTDMIPEGHYNFCGKLSSMWILPFWGLGGLSSAYGQEFGMLAGFEIACTQWCILPGHRLFPM